MHSFEPEIAARVGLNAAVIYQNIVWWTQKNAANEKNIRDGLVWTYNSRTAFGKLFPYLTQSQIKTALSKLVETGLLVKGEYNAANYDKTNWYSPIISAEWINNAIGQKSPMDWSEIANGLVRNRQPIPDIKPDIKPVVKPIDHFEDFWACYPRKIGKGNARKAFEKAMKSSTIEEISTGLNSQLDILKSKEQKFIPHAATWLNGERWNDEPDHNKESNSRSHTTLNTISVAARARRSPSEDCF